MSVIQDAIKALDGASEAAAKEVKAQLEMLTALTEAKQSQMKLAMEERVKRAKENNEIPPGALLFSHEAMHVSSSKGPAEGIQRSIGLFLEDAQENWKKALGELITAGLNVLLGSSSGGTNTSVLYAIVLQGHPADPTATPPREDTQVAIRIDYALWAYNFRRDGVTSSAESAIAYVARKSIVDYENMPSPLQIDQSLKAIGMPKAQRDEVLGALERGKARSDTAVRAFALRNPDSHLARHLATL